MRNKPLTVEEGIALPKEDRMQNLILDKYIYIMMDIKKEFFTMLEFEWWWNKTAISDEHKEFVRANLNIIG